MTNEEIFEILYSEELYDPGEPSLMALQLSCLEPMEAFNRTDSSPEGMKRREELLPQEKAAISSRPSLPTGAAATCTWETMSMPMRA